MNTFDELLTFSSSNFRTEGVLSFCAVSFVFSQTCQRNCVVLKFNLVNPGTKILVVAARREGRALLGMSDPKYLLIGNRLVRPHKIED